MNQLDGPDKIDHYGGRAYEGIWRLLARWFRVPREAPQLPQQASETIASRRPAPGFRKYLRFGLAIPLIILSFAALIGWLILVYLQPVIGLIVLLPLIALLVAVISIGLLAIELRYDTTWYVFSDRSMRLRRGIWLIRETTITFENIQNVQTQQGPLQRFFGIADVIVETAGGGAISPESGSTDHQGLIEGIENAQELRDAIREKIAASVTSGLGDQHDAAPPTSPSGFQPQHVAVLREIDRLVAAAATSQPSS